MTLGLGIDTSFDDTAVALVRDGREILSNLTVSQYAEHAEFGGVIPERASRLHVETVFPLLEALQRDTGVALTDVDFIAATHRPGLIGSLLVGVTVGKALSMALGRPLVGINHLEAHVHAALMADSTLAYPFLALLISGANTLLLDCPEFDVYKRVGATKDDAVGECIDKCGRHLGLAMPAGPALERLALTGNPKSRRFPRPLKNSPDGDFSFSGLKTAVLYALRDDPDLVREDVAAALLEAIADVLVTKTLRVARNLGRGTVVLCGGAAANLQIRRRFDSEGKKHGVRVVYPGLALCTDNAAMVAGLGHEKFRRGQRSGLDLAVEAQAPFPSP